ncbi:MAG TPA: hypothetical protein VFT72_19030 [Opitutaceae bacterium]|nr:hypothetical protein [Opitutaceae bacterium]
MNPNDHSYPTPEDLISWRAEEDPVRFISEKLKVKEMGPADHIRTKHEVKEFVESGRRNAAEDLLKRAQARRELAQSATIRQYQQQGRSISSE